MKKGQKVMTPKGKGVFLENGKGKIFGKSVKGLLLVQLDRMIGCHWNFFFEKDEVKPL